MLPTIQDVPSPWVIDHAAPFDDTDTEPLVYFDNLDECPDLTYPKIESSSNPGARMSVTGGTSNVQVSLNSYASESKAEAAVKEVADALNDTQYTCTDNQRNHNAISASTEAFVSPSGLHGTLATGNVEQGGVGGYQLTDQTYYVVQGPVVLTADVTSCDSDGKCEGQAVPQSDKDSALMFLDLVAGRVAAQEK